MCKLNILCTKIDGDCNCSNSSGFTMQGTKPMNSLLSSILTHIQNQPDIWRSFQGDPITPESELPDTSTQYSSSSPIRGENYPDESDGVFISVASELKKTLITGKPFSIIFTLSTPRNSSIKLAENVTFSAFIESKKDKNVRKLLGTVNSNGVVLFKGLIISEAIPSAQIVIKADKEFIKPFIQSIRIKEKVFEGSLKKKKLATE